MNKTEKQRLLEISKMGKDDAHKAVYKWIQEIEQVESKSSRNSTNKQKIAVLKKLLKRIDINGTMKIINNVIVDRYGITLTDLDRWVQYENTLGISHGAYDAAKFIKNPLDAGTAKSIYMDAFPSSPNTSDQPIRSFRSKWDSKTMEKLESIIKKFNKLYTNYKYPSHVTNRVYLDEQSLVYTNTYFIMVMNMGWNLSDSFTLPCVDVGLFHKDNFINVYKEFVEISNDDYNFITKRYEDDVYPDYKQILDDEKINGVWYSNYVSMLKDFCNVKDAQVKIETVNEKSQITLSRLGYDNKVITLGYNAEIEPIIVNNDMFKLTIELAQLMKSNISFGVIKNSSRHALCIHIDDIQIVIMGTKSFNE